MIGKKLDAAARQWLADYFGENVLFDEPMSCHTSFSVGGPAEAYITPPDMASLSELAAWTYKNGVPLTIVGDGTNLLVRDNGVSGVVIALTKGLREIRVESEDREIARVTAQSGVRMARLCRFAVRSGLEGMKFALGIPGTVGGGIMMNAGTVCGSMQDVLEKLTVMEPDGTIRRLERKDLSFAYRRLLWKTPAKTALVLDGCFRLKKSSRTVEELDAEARAVLEKRKSSQPVTLPSAGCFFKNPESGPGAGALIDRAGLKGRSIGGAQVSPVHANFIVNRDHATAADILALVEEVRKTVMEKSGVMLEQEVRVIGY